MVRVWTRDLGWLTVHNQPTQAFGLDDKAGVIKMIYAVMARKKLLTLLTTGVTSKEPKPEGAESEVDGAPQDVPIETLKDNIKQHVQQDRFLSEQAPDIICLKELGNPEEIFADCSSGEELAKIEGDIVKRIGHSKTFVAALRRVMKDNRYDI